MFSAAELIDSYTPVTAIAVVFVALSIAGCSADLTRFDNNPFSRAVQTAQPAGGLSATSFVGAAFGPGAAKSVPRPKADLANGGRSAEVVSLDNLAVRSASPRNRPIRISQRDRKASAASTKNNSNAVAKGAHLRRTVNSHGEHQRKAANTRPVEISPKKPVQNAAKTRLADKLATDRTPTFDWPVHGKILARFGPQPNGQKNDGIKVAVPESTPIRSAEDGVVIYAGSGLEGFGNLVLVRHTNDYVTVYAHAKELKVKRGDQIRRADIIASSGQTGNVSTPQVYFEVRKGSAPVDPLRLLQIRTEPKRGETASMGVSRP